jgi:hypothetical protein
MTKYSKIGNGKNEISFLAVGKVMVAVGIVVFYLIVLTFKMAIEGDINGAIQVFKDIPSFIIYSFEIMVVLFVVGIIITVLTLIHNFLYA